MSAALDLRPEHAAILRDVLRQHLPPGARALVFGSRAKGGARRYSDLDLALEWDRPLGLDVMAAIGEALSESDLPYRADLVDLALVAPAFRARVLAEGVALGIPPGEFLMGVPEAESEREGTKDYDNNARPQRRVTFRDGFLLGRHPVTRGEFAAFVADTNRDMSGTAYGVIDGQPQRSDKIDWRNPRFEQDDRHPVVCVSHKDAEDYAEWLSGKTGRYYRLPSEAEWEYAARAHTPTARFWGDGWEEARSYAHAEARGTAPVGSYKPNDFGLFDMLGNVWEWVADYWHDNYDGLPCNGSPWTTGGSEGRRVLRGGLVRHSEYLRVGVRARIDAGDRNYDVGFRLARTR